MNQNAKSQRVFESVGLGAPEAVLKQPPRPVLVLQINLVDEGQAQAELEKKVLLGADSRLVEQHVTEQRVMPEGQNAKDKEKSSTEHMKVSIHFAGIERSGAAHQEERGRDAQHGAKPRIVFPDVVSCTDGALEHPEIGEHVAEQQEDRAGNGADPEEHKLGVVVSGGADPSVGEGLLVAQQLRDVVANHDGDGARGEGHQGEQVSGEGPDEHGSRLSIIIGGWRQRSDGMGLNKLNRTNQG